MSRPLTLVFCCALLAGCASKEEFPPLGPRAIEKVGEVAAAPVTLPAGVDAELAPRLAAIVEAGEAGHRSFMEEVTAARSAVDRAAGAAAGSEQWVAAQTAYSRADAARAGLFSALADLDAVRRKQLEGHNPANQSAAVAVTAHLEDLARQEDAALAELAAKIG